MVKNKTKTHSISILLALCFALLASCVPTAGTNQTRSTVSEDVESGTTTGTGDSPSDSTDTSTNLPGRTFAAPVVWFSDQEVENILNINYNFKDSLYLRGSAVHSFVLNNQSNISISQKKYCMVLSYADDVNVAPLRVLATPFLFNDIGSTDYALKIHLGDKTQNQSNCGGSVNVISITSEVVRNTAIGAFSTVDLCPTCSTPKTSQNVTLYQTIYDTGQAQNIINQDGKIIPADLNLANIQLRIDYSSSIEETSSQCTNSSCRAQGFDCCVNGIQCANDGQERPETTSAFSCLSHTLENTGDFTRCLPNRDLSSYTNNLIQYGQAYSDSKTYTQNFLRYPNYYFVCASTTPEPVEREPASPENAEQDAEDRLNILIEEFNCLEEGKKESPEFNSNQVCTPTFDSTAYEATRLKVWKDCGCKADPFPTNTDDLRCPDFGLKAIKNNAGAIERVECLTPPVQAETPPFQELDVSIPNRASPHRFFASDGTEYEVIESINASENVIQEGDDFSYLDESAKQGPQFGGAGADLDEQGFGMNSILGRMSVELNRALPAKVIDVEFDQFYIISALNGFYTPCPQCVSDSWFPSFSSLPSSSKGLGVQANGYTTSRSTYRDNYSLGNFEDTKFGRACWVPPTMLPFSHNPRAEVQDQRLDRLATQAALYANGYQRDWYGFNQGALIGSFDGVSWFSVGKGRRVQAKSKKLYLAINAPFADLADPGSTSVSIIVDLGSNIAADYDYDPELELNHPEQNEGATCQSYHQCTADTDCISQLGWEYSCLDVNELKTTWPHFDVEGKEKKNTELDNQSFAQILQGGLPGSSSKRCVYRGMGSICKRDYTTLNVARPDLRKSFRCAPNFYCAELSSNSFNENVVRSPSQLNVYFFGFESDILGRPQTYVGANRPLNNNIQENITHNMRLFGTDTSDFGICRPGKSLESVNDLTNHAAADARGRTDYISQIGSCNSELSGRERTRTCPLIDMDPDSENFGNIVDAGATEEKQKLQQNMCGNESRYDDGTEVTSTFKEIELEKLASLFSLSVPGLPVDACLRRAGQVCFTDLDCGPNRLHSEQALFLDNNKFGGSDAEKKFWQESLICSQAAEIPTLQSDDFLDYDMTKNRCCREIASDFSMYSKISANALSPDIGPDHNLSLDILVHTANNPDKEKRYSRYNNLTLLGGPTDVSDVSTYTLDEDDNGIFDTNQFVRPNVATDIVPQKFQWRTFQETGKLTCCGGGWVRKFADGTNDWSSNLRQNYTTKNFQCLNYNNKMHLDKPADVTQNTYNKEKSKLCFTPDKEGCVQTPINEDEGDGFSIFPPTRRSAAAAIIDTTPNDQGNPAAVTLSRAAPYIPLPADNGAPFTSDSNSSFFPFWVGHHDSTSQDGQKHWALSIHLPIYLGGPANINTIRVRYEHTQFGANGSKYRTAVQNQGICNETDDASIKTGFETFLAATDTGGGQVTQETFCLQYTGDQVVMHIAARNDPGIYALNDPLTELPWEWAGVEINFNPVGGPSQVILGQATNAAGDNLDINPAAEPVIDPTIVGMDPGNALYYLSKLGRFELTGVPQIYFEPLYCNDDKSQLVPGIFNSDIKTRTDFESQSFVHSTTTTSLEKIYEPAYSQSDDSKDSDSRVVFQDKVELNQVFSGHEFKCCSKLGSVVSGAEKCCSGHAVADDGDSNSANAGKSICKLPKNANLHVYFNRFISSEGSILDDPEDGLREDDFVPETGEPKLTTETYTKMAALGAKHCDSGNFRRGASFAEYPAQPNTGFFGDVDDADATFYYSMVDSSQDFDGDANKGFDFFIFGLRWDHQFYCD